MEEPEDKGPEVPDSTIRAFSQNFMRNVPAEEREEIVKGILDGGGSLREKVEMAVDSGMNYGVEETFTMLFPDAHTAIDLIYEAVKDLDKLIAKTEDSDQLRALTAIRNPLAEHVRERVRAESRDDKLARVMAHYVIPLAFYEEDFNPETDISPPMMMAVCAALATMYPFAFVAWVTFRDKKDMSCNCVNCCGARFSQLLPDEQLRIIDSYKDIDAEQATELGMLFVKAWVKSARRAHRKVLAEEDTTIPDAVHERESELIVQDLFAKFKSQPT